MASSLQSQAERNLYRQRHKILRELVHINRQIDTTREQLKQLEERLATLNQAKNKVA